MKKNFFFIALEQFLLQCYYNTVIVCKYAKNKNFFLAWLKLKIRYLLCSPYIISRLFLTTQNAKDIYVYGETPLLSMVKIAKAAGIDTNDNVYELGSGAGFTCIWLHEIIGCKVTAIEQIPIFCKNLQASTKKFANLKAVCADFLTIDYSPASVVYLYGSNLADQQIIKLAELLKKTKSGTKIITVSYSLKQFSSINTFKLLKIIKVRYEWGVANVYIQIRV